MISKPDPFNAYFKQVSPSGKYSYFLPLFYLIHTTQMTNGNDFVNISNASILNIDGDNNSLFRNDTDIMETGINVTDVVEPPSLQKWLDNSQVAISVVGKSHTIQCYKDSNMYVCLLDLF